MSESKEPGAFMKFIQDYRFKMLIPELLVVFGVWYLLPESLTSNVYTFLGPWMYLFQPLELALPNFPSGILCLLTAFTLHGIYPLDNYHEGKIPDLPRAAVIMIALSFALLPVLVLFQMIGYYMTEATEFAETEEAEESVVAEEFVEAEAAAAIEQALDALETGEVSEPAEPVSADHALPEAEGSDLTPSLAAPEQLEEALPTEPEWEPEFLDEGPSELELLVEASDEEASRFIGLEDEAPAAEPSYCRCPEAWQTP